MCKPFRRPVRRPPGQPRRPFVRIACLTAAERLGYTGPDPVARSLATRRSGAVVFMLATGMSKAFSDPALSLVLDGLASALDTHDHALMMLPGTGDGPRPERLARFGVDPARIPVLETPGSHRELGREGALSLLRRSPRPTALLCMSDELAAGALQAARSFGLSVPEDLSVVGFDDTPAASWTHPQLTTVHQPLTEKGQQLGTMALALLDGREPRQPVRLDTRLVTRSSSAVPN